MAMDGGNSGRILVVDTDATQCLLIRAWLGLRGFEVTVHTEPAEGLQILDEGFEAAICGDGLPGMSSELFLRQWQKSNPHGFVILMGSEQHSERLLELIRLGAFTYLTKPVMEEKLVQALSYGRQNHQMLLGILQLSEELQEAYGQLQRQAEMLAEKQARQQKQKSELNFIKSFSYAMTTTLDPVRLAATISRELGKVVDFSFFGLDWFQHPEERLVFVSPGLDQHEQEEYLRQCPPPGREAAGPRDSQPTFHRIDTRAATPRRQLFRHQRHFALEIGVEAVGSVVLGHDAPLDLPMSKIKLIRSLAPYMALAMKNAVEHHQLRNLAEYDDLTQVFNRRMFETHLRRELLTSRRYNYQLSLMLIDVDLFKDINDTYGHQVGDAVLRKVADLLREEVRQTDLLARFGGDEFALILPHTPPKKAKVLARRLLRRFAQERFANGAKLKISVSIGIANNHPALVSDEEDLVFQADKALYQAKARGRNNLVVMDQVKPAGRLPLRQRAPQLDALKIPTPL